MKQIYIHESWYADLSQIIQENLFLEAFPVGSDNFRQMNILYQNLLYMY